MGIFCRTAAKCNIFNEKAADLVKIDGPNSSFATAL